jgi:release factor glutamine methyltransferase
MRERGLARGARALDVFTGSGVLAVAARRAGAREATAVDISRRAVANAHINAVLNRVRVRVRRGDLFAPVASERFDLITANPPYLPSADDELPEAGPQRAWDAGHDGRILLDRLCDELPNALASGGVALIVHSSLNDESRTLDRMAAAGLRAEVLARRRGPLGPLLAARAEMLERRGLLAPGEREEELVVIGAR